MQNPLLDVSHTPVFSSVDAAGVREGLTKVAKDTRAAIEAIPNAPKTYDGILGALDRATEKLDFATSIAGHIEALKEDPAFREAYNQVQPEVAKTYSSIALQPGLFDALSAFAESAEGKALEGAQKRHLANALSEFRRNGASLSATDKERLTAVDVRLSELTLKYAQNVVDATSAYELIVTDERELAGLPDGALEAAAESAQSRGQKGYRLTLQAPSYVPALTYLESSAVREKLYRAYNSRATSGAYNNEPIMAEILALRAERAKLLGFSSFADVVLENRMAKNAKTALAFLKRVKGRVDAAFHREHASLTAFKGEGEIAAWDIAYYAEKQRKALYDYDEEALRPYFSLESVLAGLFRLAGKLFSVRIMPLGDIPSWHPTVRSYALCEAQSGERLGVFHLDLFPREGKRDGAWMHGMVDRQPPTVPQGMAVIVANVTPPRAGITLLTHREVQTLFHEFGHLLHHMLSNVPVRSLAGTKVAWDFVELPSQIMENWCWEEEALTDFAKHFDTGVDLPLEIIARLRGARAFRAATAIMRQLSFATVDLMLHTTYDPKKDGTVTEFSRKIMGEFSSTPLPDDYAMIASFNHLFASPVGYAGGYYSYQWASVLEADAFERFKKEGLFSGVVGGEFRKHVLERGDSVDPSELFRAFRGRDADETPALARVGLV